MEPQRGYSNSIKSTGKPLNRFITAFSDLLQDAPDGLFNFLILLSPSAADTIEGPVEPGLFVRNHDHDLLLTAGFRGICFLISAIRPLI